MKLKQLSSRELTMASINDMVPGQDYVKLAGGRCEKIASTYGVNKETGRLNKPSEGFFGVVTESGRNVSGWSAMRYLKADEVRVDERGNARQK